MSKTDSLTDTIVQQAITSGKNTDLIIHNRTLLSLLLEHEGKGKAFSKEDFSPKRGIGKRFFLSRYLVHVITLGLIWMSHVLCCLVGCIFTGKNPLKALREMKSSPIINMAVLSIVLIMAILLVVDICMFVVNDVMFAPNNLRANSSGVISIDQPCLETHSFCLLNAATFWSNTGITINEGDKVTICVSGSMYSDVGEMDSAARSNVKLRYPRSAFVRDTLGNPQANVEDGTAFCIYTGDGARFGSLLCKICPEHKDPCSADVGEIKQCLFPDNSSNANNCFKADTSGLLYLTFNDILLTESVVKRILNRCSDSNIIKKDLLGSRFFSKDTCQKTKDTLQKIKDAVNRKDTNSVNALITDLYRNNMYKDSLATIWFKDNLGEYIVNIRVERNIRKSTENCRKKPLLAIYREIEHYLRREMGFWNSGIPWILGGLLLYVLIDMFVSSLILKKKERQPSGPQGNGDKVG